MTDTPARVVSLRTGEERVYVGLTAPEAAVAAHAQSRGDYSWWGYGRYRLLVRTTATAAYRGDWGSLWPEGGAGDA